MPKTIPIYTTVPGQGFTVLDLDLGEIALNVNNGTLYLKKETAGIPSVIILAGSGSSVVTSSYALTSSYTPYAEVALNATNSLNTLFGIFSLHSYYSQLARTASFAYKADYSEFALKALTATNASTASLPIRGIITASAAGSTITFTKGDNSTFNVSVTTATAETASYVTSSNVDGPYGKNSILSASYALTSSLPLRGLITASAVGSTITFTKGDSSTFNVTVTTATAETASYVSSSNVDGPFGKNSILSASFAVTASYVLNAVSASYAFSSSQAVSASYALSSSQAVSSSFALSASFAQTASYTPSSLSASYASTSSNIEGGTTNYVTLWRTNTALTSSVMYQSGSNITVGGGTVLPSAKLEVKGAGSTSATAALNVINASSTNLLYLRNDGFVGIGTASAASTENMFIKKQQTVFNQGADLTNYTIVDVSNTTSILRLGVETNSGGGVLAGTVAYAGIFGTVNNFPLQFITNNTVKATLSNTGNFGIGTISPNAKFDVSGSAIISGSLIVTQGITGSLFGTASWAINALTASFIQNAVSASYALSASNAQTASYVLNAISASFATSASQAVTASYVLNAVSASFASTASFVQNAVSASFASTASFVQNAVSASFASTSSLPLRGLITASAAGSTITFTKGDSSTFNITLTTAIADTASYVTSSNVDGPFGKNSILSASFAVSASQAQNATTASYILNAVSASFASTASYVLNAVSSSFAATASSADNFTVRGTLTAQTIVTQVITSSTDFVTGSSRFGTLLTNTHQFTGSVSMTGSLTVVGAGITGSLFGTASWANNAITASNALTASFVQNAVSASFASTASFVQNAVSASFASTASFVQNAVSASFASTASFVQNAVSASFALTASFVQNAVSASFAATASSADNFNVRGTLTATTIIVQTITSSTDFVTGSTRFGTLLTNTHQFTGSVSITGSLNVVGAGITGSLFGTASWANNAISSSFASTASFVQNAVSASFATSASQAITASYVLNAVSASFATSASQAQNAVTASYITSSGVFGPFGNNSILSASHAVTAAFAANSSGVSGGAANYITMWTSATTLSSSVIYQTSGKIGVGTTTNINADFDVNGVVRIKSVSNKPSNLTLLTHTDPDSGGITNAGYGVFSTTGSNGTNDPSLILQGYYGAGILGNTSILLNPLGGKIGINTGTPFTRSSLSASLHVQGNVWATSFTGSLFGTASWANNAVTSSYILNSISASFASTASFVQNAVSTSFASTASFVQNAVSASFASTASFVQNAVSVSFAATASSADNFTVRGTLTAQTIVAQVITSSTDFVTGSSRFGTLLSNTHQFTGSVSMTGSLTVVGAGITGSLFGTSSWAVSASQAITASYVLNAVSASFASTVSFVQNAVSASFAATASFVLNAVSTSFASTASFITSSRVFGPHGANSVLSASYAVSASQAFSSSYALTASFVQNAVSASFTSTASFITASGVFGPFGSNSVISASFAVSASRAITASYALNTNLNGGVINYIPIWVSDNTLGTSVIYQTSSAYTTIAGNYDINFFIASAADGSANIVFRGTSLGNNFPVTQITHTNLGSSSFVNYSFLNKTGSGFYGSGSGNLDSVKLAFERADKFEFSSSGMFRAADDIVAFYSFSDRNLKYDIRQVCGSVALDQVQQLQGVYYKWIGDQGSRANREEVGLIAQDVEKVVPQLVREQERLGQGKFKMVDYEHLTALLIEAVKEQQKQIDELKAKIDALTK